MFKVVQGKVVEYGYWVNWLKYVCYNNFCLLYEKYYVFV